MKIRTGISGIFLISSIRRWIANPVN